MRRLTGLDASFLYLETPNNHMHVAATYLYDVSEAPGWSFESMKEVVANRLHLLPPFRWRLVEVPFGVHHPIWVEDPDFDLEYHVRRGALARPGGMAELAEYAADFMSRPLDRRRPLWEMHVVEGLADGRVAVLTKTHHAAIDGVSGAELTANLLDLTPETVVYPPHEWRPERVPSDAEMLAHALRSLARQPGRMLEAVRRTVDVALHVRRVRGSSPLPVALPFAAPRTSLNTAITPHRSVAFTHVRLEDVKRVRAVFGGTVNDVVLALCTGALRRYLDEGSELPGSPLVAMVPISVRTEGERGALGNRLSPMLVALATDVADPVERLRAIQRATTGAKEMANAVGADTLSNWAEFAAPAVAARAARLYSTMRLAERHRPVFNVTISNVPGPNFPLYAAGARLTEWYPMGPIFDGGALNMTVMSYLGVVYVGLVACREAVPRVSDIARSFEESMAELLAAAAPSKAAPRAKRGGSRRTTAV